MTLYKRHNKKTTSVILKKENEEVQVYMDYWGELTKNVGYSNLI